MTPEITLSHDHIVVEGHRIERPERLSPSQWLAFWEKAIWAGNKRGLALTEDH